MLFWYQPLVDLENQNWVFQWTEVNWTKEVLLLCKIIIKLSAIRQSNRTLDMSAVILLLTTFMRILVEWWYVTEGRTHHQPVTSEWSNPESHPDLQQTKLCSGSLCFDHKWSDTRRVPKLGGRSIRGHLQSYRLTRTPNDITTVCNWHTFDLHYCRVFISKLWLHALWKLHTCEGHFLWLNQQRYTQGPLRCLKFCEG